MTTERRIVFYTPAAFSAGHDQRIANIIRALRRLDPRVGAVVIKPATYGGMASGSLAGLEFCTTIELPSALEGTLPAASVPTATEQASIQRGRPEVAIQRKCVVEKALRGITVDSLLIESFPFLTQQEADEVEHLIGCVRARSPGAAVVFSVREVLYGRRVDILRPDAKQFAEAFVRTHGGLLLVHGDPSLIRLEESYGDTSGIDDLLTYTGVVLGPDSTASPRGRHVVCSQGGQRDWRIPITDFLQAWRHLRDADRLPAETRGFIFTGLEQPGDDFRETIDQYQDCFETDRASLELGKWDDYRRLAATAACSVSQCGYNTAYELLAWGTPAVFRPRPHDGPSPHKEGEQGLRARRIQEMGWARVAMNRRELAEAIVQALGRSQHERPCIDFGGAEATARILIEYAQR